MALDLNAIKWLRSRFKDSVKFDEPMSAHTSLKIGGPAEAYVLPGSRTDLMDLIAGLCQRELGYLVIGNGTNLLVKDGGLAGVVISLSRCLRRICIAAETENRVAVDAMAGASLKTLCHFAIRNGLKGLNFALGIPGTVGGAIAMNAGTASGWMGDVLEAITVIDPTGGIRTIAAETLDFSYRALALKAGPATLNLGRPIIVDARFGLQPADPQGLKREAAHLQQARREKQPVGESSAGSVFKNPAAGKTAGELIDQAGLKGKKIGGAQISPRHANFIINTGGASAADFIALMTLIQKTVRERFSIELEAEVIIVGI